MTHPTFHQACEDIRHFAGLDTRTIIGHTALLEDELRISGEDMRQLLIKVCEKYKITFRTDDFGLNVDEVLFSTWQSRIKDVLAGFTEFGFGPGGVKSFSAGDLHTAICRALDREE